MLKTMRFAPKKLFGAVQLSLAGIIEYADLDYTRIVDRAIDDLLGVDVFDLVMAEGRQAARARFQEIVRSGEPVTATKFYRPANQGDPIPVTTSAFLLRDPTGMPAGVVGLEQRLSRLHAVQPPRRFERH